MTFAHQIIKCLNIITLAASVLTGCATSSVFQPYPAQLSGVKRQVDDQQTERAADRLNRHRDSADKILYLLERGRIAQITNDTATSIEDFRQARSAIAALEQKAIIRASDAGARGAALLINDNAIPYEGQPYERIFLYHFQAMNYLFSGNLERAMVEVRRANEEQRLAFHKHEEDIVKLQQNNRNALVQNRSVMHAYEGLANIAGHVRNSFQNAYTFYTSGVLWELSGKPNDAYIDYKKALEIFPENTVVQRDVLRLAKQLSLKADLTHFEKRFTVENSAPIRDAGELIIFFERGFAPVKQEIKIPLATHHGLLVAAFPTYPPTWNASSPLVISDVNLRTRRLGATQPIVYVQALAAQALRENLPGIIVRQVLRTAAKNEVSKQAIDDLGPAAAFATLLFNLVTEQADLRSWLTLPNDVQIYRNALTSGEHQLQLTNGNVSSAIPVQIVTGKTTLLRVIITGKTMHTTATVL